MNVSCIDAYKRAQHIEELEKRSVLTMQTIFTENKKEQALSALYIFFKIPVISISKLSELLNVSYSTAALMIKKFQQAGVLYEMNNKKRTRLFLFKEYIEILDRDLE